MVINATVLLLQEAIMHLKEVPEPPKNIPTVIIPSQRLPKAREDFVEQRFVSTEQEYNRVANIIKLVKVPKKQKSKSGKRAA